MWEITIKSSNNDLQSLNYIQNALVLSLKQDVILGRYNAVNPCISVACQDEKTNKTWNCIKKALCDIYCRHYKAQYLAQKLTFLPQDNEYFDAFIRVCTYFDRELEYKIVFRMIKYMPILNLESYFAFKLRPLKKKWQDFCEIANNNSKIFLSNETFLSLLKFLISSLDAKTDCVIVSPNDGCITYLDEDNNQILLPINNNISTICALIDICPRKIILKGTKITPIFDIIKQFFEDKIDCQKN